MPLATSEISNITQEKIDKFLIFFEKLKRTFETRTLEPRNESGIGTAMPQTKTIVWQKRRRIFDKRTQTLTKRQ